MKPDHLSVNRNRPIKFMINLASEDFERVRIIRAGLYLLSGILFVAMLFGINRYLIYKDRAEDLQEGINMQLRQDKKLEEELNKKEAGLSENEMEALVSEVSFANSLIRQKAFSWTLFLSDLETAIPKNISVSSIQPQFNEGVISLLGTALSLEDLTNLIISLEDSPVFEEVFLNNQKTIENGFVQFTIKLGYSQRKG